MKTLAATPAAAAFNGLVHRIAEALAADREARAKEKMHRRVIQDLNAFDDDTLRDIGLTRSDIERAVRLGRR